MRLHSRSGEGGGRRLWLSATAAALLVVAAVPATASAAPFAYVTNEGGGFGFTASQYNVRAAGLLAPLFPPTVATGRRPIGIAMHPGGRSVYVANARETYVSQYDVGADGRLSPKSPATVAAGEFPSRIAVSPDGKSAYVTTTTGTPPFPGVVAQYDVGPGGRLSPKDPAMVASGGLGDIVVSPDGRSVYVTAEGRIRQYTVGPGGRLSPKSPPTVPAGPSPVGLAVSPDGRSVYVANSDGNSVSQYNVGAGGRLSPKTPATVAAGDAPVAVAVTPGGRSVYVANTGLNSATYRGTISQYSVGSGGKLFPKTPSQVTAGLLTIGVTVSPNGRSVYATNNNSGTVSQYDIGGGGRLSPKTPPTVATDGGPAEIAITPPTPGWEGRVTNAASGCSVRVQVPYLDGSLQVTAYTEVFCPRPTRLTVRSRLRSDYPSGDVTVAQRGCTGNSACVVDQPQGFRYFRLTCPKSATRRQNQPYYSDIVLYPGTNSGAATKLRSQPRALSPFCAS